LGGYDLKKVPLFASLRPAELESLAACLRPVELPAGAFLFSEGERGDRFYIVAAGEIEIIKAAGTPEERILHLRHPGDFLGEMSMFEPDRVRTASVRARSPGKLLELSHADFQALLHRQPSLAYQVICDLSLRARDADNATIEELRRKNLALSKAYEELQAAQEQIIEKEKLERELQVARRIQQSMLPRTLPALPGFDFGALMLPARAVGGDLYDFIPLSRERVGILVGDVSDKGVPAALFMALCRSLLRAEAARSTSPTQVLRRVNHHLLQMNQAGMFITLLYGILHRTQRTFSYARAGHELPLHYARQGQPQPIVMGQGMLLGVFERLTLDEQTLPISPGDTVLLFSDGAIDAIDACNTRFGYPRLQAAVQSALGQPAQAVCNQILQDIQAYHGSTPQADDITLVAIQGSEP
jgi:serine phosphatase RsbU (regulator of sigma subunit)